MTQDAAVADRLERRLAFVVIAVATLLFLALIAIAPIANPTFDDAKYVAVGRNFLAGKGPVTEFGVLFLKHSPLWPMIIVEPERLFGISAIRIGQLLNALSGAGSIVLIGILGWRVRPLVGAIAAAIYASLPYVFDIARTAGIDLPSIALTLLFVLVGFAAVRRGSIGLSIVAGLLAAASFLIKETIIPFAAVPFIAGVTWGIPWRSLGRTAATTLAVATVGTSWWFVMFAGYTDRVYRAEFPAWTLGPIAVGIALACVLGFALGPIADRLERRAGSATGGATAGDPRGAAGGRRFTLSRLQLGWLATGAWFVLLVVFFQRTPKLLGASLFNRDQVIYWATHLNWTVRLALAYGVGSLFAFVEMVRAPRRVSQATIDLAIAVISGLTLVILVIGVGETPRHYIAELALAIALGTVGWFHAARRLLERDRLTIGLLALIAVAGVAVGIWYLGVHGLPHLGLKAFAAGLGGVVAAAVLAWLLATRRQALIAPAVAGIALVGGMGLLGARTVTFSGELDRLETQATAKAVDWINTYATPGRTVAIGPYLAMGISILVPPDRTIIQVRHFLAIADPKAPYGLRSAAGPLTDPIAVDTAPSKANQFNVYSASQVRDMMVKNNVEYYVYAINREESSASILATLTPQNGFTEVSVFPFEGTDHHIDVHVYRVDATAMPLADKLYISADALDRLVDRLERDPVAGRTAATNLVARIAPAADGSEETTLARLQAIAAG